MALKERLEEKLQAQTQHLNVEMALKDLPNPSELKNCNKAAKRIVQYLMEGKRMLVVGDYDADGIMATTVLISFLREAGFSPDIVDYKIPSRLVDGYGVSPNIVYFAEENGFDFIVTVDNGVAAVEAIALANEKGIPVIVTDHHTAPAVLPAAEIIVNPRVAGETFPFPYISGATVAWYLVAALQKELDIKIDIRKYLDFVAITVISDVMPMDNINLAIVRYGMEKIKQRSRYFYELVWDDWQAPTINETSIGFNLVPMINAIGRIEDANLGVKLFTSRSKAEIKELFDFLKETNENRKFMTRQYVKEAEEYLSDLDLDAQNAIVVRNEKFHEGIVGIIAGKLAEKYNKPAYVFGYNKKKGVWKGSGRSVANIHLYDLTTAASEAIFGFGGHKGAVGVAVKEEHFELFEELILKEAAKFEEDDFFDKNLEPIECELHEIDHDVLDIIKKYGPYGNGNPSPMFKTTAQIKVTREMKDGLHFKTEIKSDNHSIVGLFFQVEKEVFLEQLENEMDSDILFYPSLKYDLRTQSFSYELFCTLL